MARKTIAKDWLEALRPLHWLKSGFCLAALFFGGLADEAAQWVLIFPLVVGFSLLASAGYLVNDCVNRCEDRQHPRKKARAIASGRIPVQEALSAAGVIALSGLIWIWWSYWGRPLGSHAFFLSVSYLLLTLSYSLLFRSLPIVDVLVLSLGFVIRVAVGAYALGLQPTLWLLGCTYSVSLMLGFGKRMGEWQLLNKRGRSVGPTRPVLRAYTEEMLRTLIGSTSLLAGGLYAAYCLSQSERPGLLLSIFPVITGLMGYLRVAWRSEVVETPENLVLRSSILSSSLFVWLVLVIVVGFQ